MTTNFSQTDAQFEEVKKAAISALRTVFPVEGKLRKVTMEKAWAEDTADSTDYRGQMKTKLSEGTWGIPVYAHLKLIDLKTKEVVDENPRVRLFNLPKPTARHSFIVGGNEYQVSNQLRLKPGVYTIRKQNGELKTQINLARGKNFDIVFDEPKGAFYIQKVAGGQANIPLLPILEHLGISRAEISRQWGERLTASNEARLDPKAVDKLEAALGLRRNDTLKDYFSNSTEISPDTTKTTLGKSFTKVDGLMLLAASKKLLDVHMGRQEADDRDSLEFKALHGIDDFIRERLEKNSQTLAYRIKRTVDNMRRVKLSQLVSPAAFSSVIETFFTGDDKSNPPEQTNPLEMLSGTGTVTFMGAGGIGSTHAVTNDMRQIHPSHFGLIDPVHTPSSEKIGVNLHLPLGAIKDGQDLRAKVIDRQGREAFLTPTEMRKFKIGFPDEKGTTVRAMVNGVVQEIPRKDVDYFIPRAANMFSWSTNLIPFLPSAQGNRAEMASKMLEQAISLKHREQPLVQTHAEGDKTFDQLIGAQASVRAPEDGVVKSITPDEITLEHPKGVIRVNLYNNFVLNRKSFLHNTPVVKVGDKVKKGQLLADSNFTQNGVLALGTNLKTAYLNYKGFNFDDGIVISRAAADKLTSEHVYRKELPLFETVITGLETYKSFYPTAVSPKNLSKLDRDGVIKVGEKVQPGDTLITGLQKRTMTGEVMVLSKVLSERPKDIAVRWTNEDEGHVIDVLKTPKKITVVIKTEEAAKIGDKLSNRHGGKGVITKVVPNEEMPKTKSGEPVDILMSPMGIISRINISQTFESAAGKAAQKLGKPYVVKNFDGENNLQKTKALMAKAGVDDKEELFDGMSGKSLGQVHVGMPHILKLFKQSQGNYSVRQGGPGHGYDANLQPLKAGGEEGAKSLDPLTMYSLLSHGARENLREMAAIKSTKNDEFWKALKSGEQLPPPQSAFIYDKFLTYLKGAGIDTKKEGTTVTLAPLTDKQVHEMSNFAIKEPLFYRAKDFSPIKGGFFDSAKLGGFKGNKWGHIELAEPVINPTFENAVKKITNLGGKFDDVMAGKLHLDTDGTFNREGKGVTGGAAIEKILKTIDVDQEIATLKQKALKSKGATLDDLNKRLRYLTALQTLKMRPEDAYIRKVVPVVPTQFRPIYPLPDGNMTTTDPNFIYRNLGVINKMMELPVMKLLDEKHKTDIRQDLYEHVKGITGITDLNIQGKPREGFISAIKGGEGGQPKEGLFISKLLSKRQDYVGRGTIIPEPSLGIDEMAMPEPMAWKLFEPFIIRELRNHGKTPLQAMDEIKQQTPLAKRALELVMERRHVLLNRAPSLHKFSIMAFKPKITDGKSIKIQSLVNKGFGADFDGDTMTVHVPITDEANTEAAKMLPSRNLYQPGSKALMLVPSQEALLGLYYLSKTPTGRKSLEGILGPQFPVKDVLDKKGIIDLLKTIAQKDPSGYGRIVQALKEAGEHHVYSTGFTVGVNDVPDFSAESKKIVSGAKKIMATASNPLHANKNIQDKVDEFLKKKLEDKNNPFYDQIISGAKGSPSQLRSILISPLFVADQKNRVIPNPISKPYASGLTTADYWMASYGVRKGLMDTAIQTSLPGAFSKNIMATTLDNVISKTDCGTKDGIMMPLSLSDAQDRFTAGEQNGIPHNTLVDANLANRLKAKGVSSLKVRSPLKCLAPKGTCAHCYGLDENGHLPEIGENVGAKCGQTISEPLVQMVMSSKHTGGVAGTGAQVAGYQRVNQLLTLPKVLPGAAALAPVEGKITKIVKGVAGGFDVHIGEHKAHISHGLKPIVEVGQVVAKGDALSEGPIRPQELTELKGAGHAQNYITGELQKAYKEQGVGINRKTFETVVRSLTNITQVTKPPKGSDWLPGDIIPLTIANHYNENRVQSVAAAQAVGMHLAEGVGSLRAGHVLTDKEASALEANGVHEVKILSEELQHKPFVKSMQTLPIMKHDWMAALGYQNISKVLQEGASQGWKTDLESYHPVPPMAYGVTFGKGKEGKY